MDEKEKLRRKVVIGVAPTGFCAACQQEFFTDELFDLPEVDAYARKMSVSILRGETPPPPPSDDMLKAKYGYGISSLFCRECLSKLGAE